MKITYESKNFRADTLSLINQAETICEEYARQGYDLTLRQLYYQFVARGYFPNNQKFYDRLGVVVNDARLAGLIDWNHIVDRTRNLMGTTHWDDPAQIIRATARSFHLDKWEDQPTRVEVWVEKEALAGVIQRAADAYDCDWFSCRGYVSQSEMWRAGQRLAGYVDNGQDVLILHLGDHDPSGLDMSRDIEDRLWTFMGTRARQLEVRRIALNMNQVEEYNPPPNPTKLSDARSAGYVDRFGMESWELDALDPAVLDALIREHIAATVDQDLYDAKVAEENNHKALLTEASRQWSTIAERLEDDL